MIRIGGLIAIAALSQISVAAEPVALPPAAPMWVHGKVSYILANGETRVAITETGGHMIAWFGGDADNDPSIAPYHLSPWQEEKKDEQKEIEPAILNVLRGDFFCLPFGGNAAAYKKERHPPHGETANGNWSNVEYVQDGDSRRMTLQLQTQVRRGTVTKEVTLTKGEPVIYTKHKIKGFAGPAPLGHHATLALPEKEGALRVSTSPFKIGLTNPTQFSDPAKGEYQALAIDAKFDDLTKVPQIFKGAPDADCTKFPARRGYADLLCVVNEANGPNEPAWVAAVNNDKNYLWFALKDPTVLPSLLFWIENHGRHGAPWSGRNNCLGLEDLCTYFADGLVPSVNENALSKLGVPTTITLTRDKPTEIRYIQGAVAVPEGFEKVERVEFSSGQAKFIGAGGKEVVVKVNHEFLQGK